MSQAGRRCCGSPRPTRAPLTRFGAALTALGLAAGVIAPAALVSDGTARSPQHAAVAPVDQIRARQWHLDAMRVPRAWRSSKGEGVTVAVLDTGVDRRHPDLVGRVASGPDLTGGTRRPGSKYWGLHGTSMASIIAGHGNGPGRRHGVIGVAPSSKILSVRVTWENDDPQRQEGEGDRNRNAVAQGIRYAVDHGADIINMSLGGGRLFYDGNSIEESAVRYALDRDVVLIASAGNDGAGPNRNNYPAAYRGVIAVGALDRRLRLWKDSNRRPYVAVCAPGVEIVSAGSGNGYVIGTGTSPSSAIVAGVAALVRARYPELEPEDVREALVKGVPPGRPTGSSTCTGPLDAVRALAAAAKIDRATGGAERKSRSPAPAPAPYVEGSEDRDGLLLAAILAGGGFLIGAGVLLSRRRRRGPEAEPDDFDELEDYGLGAPPMPRRPVPVMAAREARHAAPSGPSAGSGPDSPSGPYGAPVNAPLWQSNEVFAAPPVPPAAGRTERPEDQSARAEASSGSGEVPPIPSELRPFLPRGEGQRDSGPLPAMDDEEWDRFRWKAFPAAPPPSAADGEPPGGATLPDDDWHSLPKRRRRPSTDDESLPPWW